MSDMSDSEALDHYRIEVARLRKALQAFASDVAKVGAIFGMVKAQDVADELHCILNGGRS